MRLAYAASAAIALSVTSLSAFAAETVITYTGSVQGECTVIPEGDVGRDLTFTDEGAPEGVDVNIKFDCNDNFTVRVEGEDSTVEGGASSGFADTVTVEDETAFTWGDSSATVGDAEPFSGGPGVDTTGKLSPVFGTANSGEGVDGTVLVGGTYAPTITVAINAD